MAIIEKTAFEVKNSNIRFNDIQNVPGYFGTVSQGTFTPADCSAGMVCKSAALAPCEGYEDFDILNGNTHQFVAAADGSADGYTGDHTGLYVCNTHDIEKMKDSQGNVYSGVAANTLGLGLPAGERCAFTELIVGEKYKWGEGNFSTLPTEGQGFATLANGLWVGASAAPTDGSVYAEILPVAASQSGFIKGLRYAFGGYWMKICRSVAASE
jgi:hypothetical protein